MPRRPRASAAPTLTAWSFMAPLLLLLALFVAVPVLGTLHTSFFRDVTFLPRGFAALANYRRLVADPAFWQSVRFTLLFIAVSAPLELVAGMMLALLLNYPSKLRTLLRVSILIPWAIPAAVGARIWELMYNYEYGLANWALQTLRISAEPVNWLGSATGAFFAVVIADAWKTTPFVTIILLAGLSAIPDTLYQQARIDGAHFGQRFLHVTLPLMKPIIVVALLFRTIDALRIFDMVYVLTSGGPGGATDALSLLGYRQIVGGDFGYGAAVSVSLFLIAFTLSLIYVHVGRFREGVA
jgi:multiple sugar transport system permease protein